MRYCCCGCHRQLLRSDGTPDYSRMRRFFNKECKLKDNKDRKRFERKRYTRCPNCNFELEQPKRGRPLGSKTNPQKLKQGGSKHV